MGGVHFARNNVLHRVHFDYMETLRLGTFFWLQVGI